MFEVVVGGVWHLCHHMKCGHQSLRWWWGNVWHQTPPPTTTPKLQLDYLDLENFIINVWGGGGGVSGTYVITWNVVIKVRGGDGGMSDTRPPPTTTPKLQLDFLDLENFIINIWGGGGGVSGTYVITWNVLIKVWGGGGGVSGTRHPPPPPTTTPKLQLDFLDLENSIVNIWDGGGGWGCLSLMSSYEIWRHTLVILSNVECARIGWSDVQTPHPHHHP